MKKLSIKSLKKNKKKGFTLVELIIVIAIIAILAAIAIPKMGTVKHNANIKADIANAKNIHTAAAGALVDEKLTLTNGVANIDLSADDANAKAVKERLDAFSTTAKTDSSKFSVEVVKNGDVIVKAGNDEVYPTQKGEFQINKAESDTTDDTKK